MNVESLAVGGKELGAVIDYMQPLSPFLSIALAQPTCDKIFLSSSDLQSTTLSMLMVNFKLVYLFYPCILCQL